MLKDDNAVRPSGAAELAGVSEATVRRWVREGRLNRYDDGLGRMWLDRDEVLRLVRPVTGAQSVTGAGA